MPAADKFENSTAGKKLLALLNDKKMAAEFGQVLAELAVELADAYAARDHFKRSLDTVIAEHKIALGCLLMEREDRRLVIRKSAMEAIPDSLELFYDNPEPGVKVYCLRDRRAPPKVTNSSDLQNILAQGNA